MVILAYKTGPFVSKALHLTNDPVKNTAKQSSHQPAFRMIQHTYPLFKTTIIRKNSKKTSIKTFSGYPKKSNNLKNA